jgi:DNA polymerase-4
MAIDDKPRGWRDAEQAVDRAALRYGSGTVRPAALVRGEDDHRR